MVTFSKITAQRVRPLSISVLSLVPELRFIKNTPASASEMMRLGLSVSSPNVSEIDIKNFWDPKGYLTVSRRTAHGYALCDQFRHMIEELESVIASFTKSLNCWSDAWRMKIGSRFIFFSGVDVFSEI